MVPFNISSGVALGVSPGIEIHKGSGFYPRDPLENPVKVAAFEIQQDVPSPSGFPMGILPRLFSEFSSHFPPEVPSRVPSAILHGFKFF